MEKNKVISLFSGAGGLDIGLEKSGLDVVLCQEFDRKAVETLKSNKLNVLEGDIRTLINDDPSCNFLLRKANIQKNQLFAVVGGPPCQSFSTAGKRGGLSDPRGTLFNEFVTVVDKLKPRFFVMENVKGLLSSKYLDNGHEHLVIDYILSEFKSIGYRTVHGVLLAANYGSPQLRERLIIIGSRDHEDIYLPIPTVSKNRYKTLKEAFKGLKDSKPEFIQFSNDRLSFLKKIPEGGNWKSLSTADQKKAMGNAFFSGGGKVGFFRRLSFSKPSPTILTSPLQKATMLAHPTKLRPLSVAEYARIQEFPDDWIFIGKTTDKYKQIGNAVPTSLAKAIGKTLIDIANGGSKK